MQAADHNVVVSEQRCEIICAIGIALPRDDAVETRHSLRMPHDGCDAVSAPYKLGKNARSGIAGRTDQRHPHHLPPAANNLRSVPPYLATFWQFRAQQPATVRQVCVIAVFSVRYLYYLSIMT
jgi:hypothetical protein